jgi:hypothetical protein
MPGKMSREGIFDRTDLAFAFLVGVKTIIKDIINGLLLSHKACNMRRETFPFMKKLDEVVTNYKIRHIAFLI